MENEPSLDEMWNVIEKFGIKREILDPHDNLTYEQIHNLYLTIKNNNSSTEGDSEKNQQIMT